MACAHCNGRGEIKVPEYVAADAVRHVGYLLQNERVHRVELVCSPRVGSTIRYRELLAAMKSVSRCGPPNVTLPTFSGTAMRPMRSPPGS